MLGGEVAATGTVQRNSGKSKPLITRRQISEFRTEVLDAADFGSAH